MKDWLLLLLGMSIVVCFAFLLAQRRSEDQAKHPDLRVSAESEWQIEIAERDRQIRECTRRGGVAAMGFGRTVVCVKPMEKE